MPSNTQHDCRVYGLSNNRARLTIMIFYGVINNEYLRESSANHYYCCKGQNRKGIGCYGKGRSKEQRCHVREMDQ